MFDRVSLDLCPADPARESLATNRSADLRSGASGVLVSNAPARRAALLSDPRALYAIAGSSELPTDARLAAVTTKIDWLVLALLLLQVATGVYIAFSLRWGGVWYVHTATPWLRSLLTFQPEVQHLAALPVVVKLHACNAFLLVALLPFSRLVHALSVPLGYLARPYQVVIWYREQRGK